MQGLVGQSETLRPRPIRTVKCLLSVDSGSWFDHVLMWEKYKEDHPEIPIHFVQYENLKEVR